MRELENVIQRGLALTRGNVLHIDNVPAETRRDNMGLFYREELKKGRSLKDILADLESRIIRETLAEQAGNRSRTAERLHVHRRYLYTKMKQYRLH